MILHRECNSIKSVQLFGEKNLVNAISSCLSGPTLNPSWGVGDALTQHSHELPLTWKPSSNQMNISEDHGTLSYFMLKGGKRSGDDDVEIFSSDCLVCLFWPDPKSQKQTEAVAKLLQEYYASFRLDCYKKSRQQCRSYAKKMVLKKKILLCRHIDGRIIACAALDMCGGGVAEISHIFVREEFRGRRLGSRCVTALCTHVRQSDLNCRIFLFLQDNDIASQRSLHRVGFRPFPATVSYLRLFFKNDNDYRYYKLKTITTSAKEQIVDSSMKDNDVSQTKSEIAEPQELAAEEKSDIDVYMSNESSRSRSNTSFSDPEPVAEDVYEESEIEKWKQSKQRKIKKGRRKRWRRIWRKHSS
mmetsp:Transcript_11125/g.13456  ORF Transcript_11125/g.13456 Transcript_11125/m.13456 type:complete len:358 (-) Transcript_11125:1548-2621(-)